jgi:hypothetical protein
VIEDLEIALKNQRILVISPKFFGYETLIVKRLKELGSEVVWLDDRPSNSVYAKLVMRYFPFLYRMQISNYYKKNVNGLFTKILVINTENLSYKNMCYLKEKTKAKKLILYMWDSLKNKNRWFTIVNLFDKCLTFDSDDARKYNFLFRPLFFTSDIDCNESHHIKYDISFIGTGHSDRVEIIERIKQQCNLIKLDYFFYLYLQSPLVYFFYKIIKLKQFKKIKRQYFFYKPLGYNDYIDISESSNVIFDIEHPKQKGLTMRTFEALGKEKKLITTNSNIKKYDFYNDVNICVIDRKSPVIDRQFFEKKYEKLPDQIYYKYSINGWLEDIFL